MNAPSKLAIVNVHDAKTNFSKLLDRAHRGEEIILAKAGEPWAKIVPYDPRPKFKRVPGGLTVTGPIPDSAFFDPLPEEDLAYIDDRPLEERR